MTLCKLCEEKPAIKNSHIIPEFMYQSVYDANHRFMPFSTDEFESQRIEQKGYRDELLCLDCEGKFSVFEGKACQFVKDLHSASPTDTSENYLLYKIQNYEEFKRCSLSILWRMGVSTLDPFKFYKLGPYEAKLKEFLLNDKLFKREEFPILLSLIFRESKICDDILITYKKMGRLKHLSAQSFIASGFLFDIIMTTEKFPEDWKVLIDPGTDLVAVRKIDINEIQKDAKLIDFDSKYNAKPVKFYQL